MSKTYHYQVHIFFEDTDHSGLVYHPNYIKFFERARQTHIGIKDMQQVWKNKGLVPAIYKIEITYSSGVTFGETLDIRSTYKYDGEFRMLWEQEAWKEDNTLAAKAITHIVTVDSNYKLAKFTPELYEFLP